MTINEEVSTPLKPPRPSFSSPFTPSKKFNDTPRLIITKMVLENFKSYAGVREIGPFHKSFTSIVGPNGSGKSNVIDAIQFVFGKRGTKLRLKKLSELIHNSENHQGLRKARVSVHFCEIIDHHRSDNDYDVVPRSEIVVTRTVDQKSTSKYYINDTTSSFKEVTDLLKEKGIDLENNRFLILQGEVEQISLMKPIAANEHETGLLEYIEDIIGTNQYIDRISKAETSVEELNEKRTEKLNRLKSVEHEKDGLEGAKNEAVEYLRKKKQSIKHQHVLLQFNKHVASKKLKEVEESKSEIKTKYESERDKLKEMKDQRDKIEKEYTEIKQNHDLVATELKTAKDNWAAFERKDIKLKGDKKNIKEKNKKLEASIKEADGKIEALKKKIEKSEKSEKKESEIIEKLSVELENAEKSEDQIYKELQSEIEPIRIEKEKKQKEILPISKQLNDIKQKVDVTQSEIDILKEKSESVQKQYDESLELLQKKKDELKKTIDNLAKYKKHQQQIEKRIPESKNTLSKISEEESAAESEYQKSRGQYQVLTDKMRKAKTKGKLMSSLMQQKEEGTIKGICDRLGSLGTIDKKYDVAISTACGALNHIVVDTTDAGIQCVEFLRANSLGVATFIMLDKIATPEMIELSKGTIETPEKVPRLFDLIKFKSEKYRVAFYFALRDTLVAKDLDQASRIAYQSKDRIWRVVTLKGELIEQSGTMSGGGSRAASGGMSASFEAEISSKEVKIAQKNSEDALENLTAIQQKKSDISAQLKTLEIENSNLQMTISKTEMEIKGIEAQIQDLNKTIADLKPHLNDTNVDDDNRLLELEATIKDLKKAKKQTEDKYKKAETEIKILQEKIDNAGDGKLQKQKERAQLLADQINEARQKLTKVQVQKENAQKNLAKAESQLSKDRKDYEAGLETQSKITQDLKDLMVQAQAVFDQVENAKNLMEKRDKELQEKEQEYDKIKKDLEKSRSAEVDFKNKLDDFEKNIKEFTREITTHSKQMLKLEKDIEEYLYESDDEEEADDQLENQNAAEEQTEATHSEQSNEESVEAPVQLGKRKRTDETEVPQPPQKKQKTSPLPILEDEQLEKISKKKLEYDITVLEAETEKMKPNIRAINEYKQKEKEYNQKFKDLEETTKERDRMSKEKDDLKKRRLNEFMAGFKIITSKLKEIYQMITLGGDAELELVDTFDPFREGIEFSVRPPKKSWKKISNLSGGEKTLSSLALVFALHHYKPTPIYVMDEIDAALDFKNVSIVANYIKERTKNAQFLVISLRNNMFELADILVGIYKTDNATKSVTIDPNKIRMNTKSATTEEEAETTPKKSQQPSTIKQL